MYRLHSPAEPLRPYIENYWFVSHAPGEDVDLRVEVFVDARADLIFNFEDPYRREIIGGGSSEHSRSNLDAQRLWPIRILQHGAVRIAGVRFQLGGLAPFTRAPLAAWSGRTPSPEQVFGAEARELEAALRGAADAETSAQALDEFFIARLRIDGSQVTFERALSALVSSDGVTPVGDLAEIAATSPRQIERLFARGLGFPPKTVGRVIRFQHALRRLMSDPGVPLGKVAADTGYYDQAHFVRDFRLFSGGVPRGYRGYYPPEGPADFAPNVVVFIQDADPPEGGDWTRPRTRGRDMAEHWSGTGTPDDPWKLKTPPLSSEYTIYRDDSTEPGLLVCQVGGTRLTYLARAIDDLHAMLLRHGDWMPLGAADEQKAATEGTVEAWGRSEDNPVGGWYGQKKGLRGRFAMYVPPLLEALGLVELEHNARNNRVRAAEVAQ